MVQRECAEFEVYSRLPVEIASGDGVELVTADGESLLDFYGGHAAALLGQGHPLLYAALVRQARRLLFQSNAVELSVRQRAIARLAAFAPDGLDRVFFVNSGAEANENALRLAFRATGQRRVIALEGGFHGRTAAAAACSHGAESWYGFPRGPFDVRFVPPDDVDALENALGDDTAAVILEPVQGMAGARVVAPQFVQRARTLCDSRGALLVADEVQCGMGRTGEPFAISAAGVVPDVITVAKGVAGGFPCGAVIATPEVAGAVGPGDLGSTFGGGPLACALVEAVVDVLERPGILEHVRAMAHEIEERCRGAGPVLDVQGRGLLLGLRTAPPAADLLPQLRAQGVLAGGARDPHIIRLLPPLTVERRHVDALVRALEGIEV